MAAIFHSLQVRTKIVGAFAVVLAMTVALGLFAVSTIATLDTNAIQVRDETLPATRAAGKVAHAFMRYRTLEGALALSEPETRAGEIRSLDEQRRTTDASLAAYTRFANSDELRRASAELTRLWAAYTVLSKNFTERVLGNDIAGASRSYRTDMRTTSHDIQAVTDVILRSDTKQADATIKRGEKLVRSGRVWILSGLGIALAFCVACGWALIRGVSTPIVAMTSAMQRLARGDHDLEIPATGRHDEVGEMASAVQVFKNAAIDKLRLEVAADAAHQASEIAHVRNETALAEAAQVQATVVAAIGAGLEALSRGDLTTRIERPFAPAYEQLRTNFNEAMERLHELVGNIVLNTDAIRSSTSGIAGSADELSGRTEQQAASLEEVAATLAQITTTVERTAEGARQAGTVVDQVRAKANHSGKVVQDAVAAMGQIENSSAQISQIIGVIDEIAFQTNLLALNAGVEAARAGEAGRGFAVVATEVRALAQRAADAAKQIKALISTSTSQVGQGVTLVGATGQALGELVDRVAEISTTMTMIAAAAQEQAVGLVEVSAAVSQMDQITQQNAAMVEESTAASHALEQETAQLAKLTGQFRLGAERASPGAVDRRAPAPSRPDTRRSTLKLVHPRC